MKQTHLLALGVLVVLALLSGLAAWQMHAARPSATGPLPPPQPLPVVGEGDPAVVPPATQTPTTPPPVAAEMPLASPPRSQPLPQLVPGNPLTDDHFAHLSSKIIIAAVGFKGQPEWEVKVIEYMDKVLSSEKITAEQYEEYAQALTRNVERGAAVAENTLRRVEKKLGTRMEVEALPMFKFDENTRRSIEKKLRQ